MSELEQRVTKIDVLAESYLADLEVEELAYTMEKLLSDLGGNLGLWIGVSVLTVLEILDLLLSYIRLAVGQQFARRCGCRSRGCGESSNRRSTVLMELSAGSYRQRRASVYPSCYLHQDSAGSNNNGGSARWQPETHYF
ncbi:hypothetical protein BOX15_Mlig013326g1 [Macrostomum lignano]|uniref:Uncharacterized protein n=1 Tax=Macrostomum lignano TaxID=282301 RepID=A0A267F1U0_9PLAT|nr:hypothetical protein BOX15_Mlig013326g1 [Macrostomum lignano]